jgi:hypothetical protein
MDAKDLLVHSPRVISETTPCMFDIKLLRFMLLIGSSKVLGGQQHGGRGPLGGCIVVGRDRR